MEDEIEKVRLERLALEAELAKTTTIGEEQAKIAELKKKIAISKHPKLHMLALAVEKLEARAFEAAKKALEKEMKKVEEAKKAKLATVV